MKKPFPVPPFVNNRVASPTTSPFGNEKPEDIIKGGVGIEDHPRLTDEETMFLLKQYLRKDQLADTKLLKFIMHYLECRNASEAARFAGLNNGSYWRSRPEIHSVIEAITAKAVMKYGYDAHEVIERVKEISALDPVVFENPDGSYKERMSDIPPDARRAIKSLTVKNVYGHDANGMPTVVGKIIKYEIWDKLKASELLGREKNIMKQTTVVEHDVTQNMASLLLDSSKRAEERKLLLSREVGGEGQDSGDDERWSGDGVPIAADSGSGDGS